MAEDRSAASLRWHYEDGTWWAESPEFLEWSGGASSLEGPAVPRTHVASRVPRN